MDVTATYYLFRYLFLSPILHLLSSGFYSPVWPQVKLAEELINEAERQPDIQGEILPLFTTAIVILDTYWFIERGD